MSVVPQVAVQMLTLAAALAQASARNPEIVAARKEVAVARAVLTSAAPNPLQIQAAQGTTQDVPRGLGALQTFTAGASQVFSPTIAAQRSVAGSGVRIAQARFLTIQRNVGQRVIAAYYGLASAQAAVVATQQSVANARELEKSARLRAHVGAVGAFEVLRAQVELRRVQTDLLRARAGAHIAQIALDVLLGQPSGMQNTVQLTPHAVSTPDIETLFVRARQIDPLIAQYRAAADRATAQQRAAELQRLPSLGLQAGYLFQRAPGAGGAVSRGPTASVTLSLPLIDFGTIRGAVKEAQARESIAQAQIQGRAASLESEVSQDVVDLESAQDRLSYSKTSLSQAREGLRLAQFGYSRGALGVLDVFSARNELAAAQAEVTQAAADQAAAYARLQLITGATISP